MNVVLLAGARNNCGDYLIVDRAQRLFDHFLPAARRVTLDRTRPFREADIQTMAAADLVVLVGGPMVRNACAEALNLAALVESGFLATLRAPLVMMGAGGKPPVPFVPGKLALTRASRALFDKLEASPYYSSTRDFETLLMLRNAGYGNFRFTGCPALYALPERARPFPAFRREGIRRIAFSCGAPGLMSAASIRQHLDLAEALRARHPHAEVVVAAHHAVDEAVYRTVYGRNPPEGWVRFWDEIRRRGFRMEDLSGGLERMEGLYGSADLHVGYRVHAHVLMTSWRKPSVLVAEDGRASGMADVITGRVWPAWRPEKRQFSRLLRLLGGGVGRRYDARLSDKVMHGLEVAEHAERPLNQFAYPTSFDAMVRWFAQFWRGGMAC